MTMQRWLYHPTEGARIFEGDEIDRRRAAGWFDSPKLFPVEPVQVASEASGSHKPAEAGSTPAPATRKGRRK